MTTHSQTERGRIVVQQISDVTISIFEGETPRIPINDDSSVENMTLMAVNFISSGSLAAFLFFNPRVFGNAIEDNYMEKIRNTLRNLVDKGEIFRIGTDLNKPLVVVIKRDNNGS